MESYITKLYLLVCFSNIQKIEEFCKKNNHHILAALKRMFPRRYFIGISNFEFSTSKTILKLPNYELIFKARIPWYTYIKRHDKIIEIKFNYSPKKMIYEIFESTENFSEIDFVIINMVSLLTGEIKQRKFNYNLKPS